MAYLKYSTVEYKEELISIQQTCDAFKNLFQNYPDYTNKISKD